MTACNIRLVGRGKMPVRGSAQSAGLDLYSSDSRLLLPLVPVTLHTGIVVELPRGHVGRIWPRSGLSRRGIQVLGGVLDSDYRGELMVILVLLSWRPYFVRAGDRVAQLAVLRYVDVGPTPTLMSTERGAAGLGSTGR